MSDYEDSSITYTVVSSPFGGFRDLDKDPEDDPEEDPADYPANKGDEGNDEDESSDDNKDDDIDIKGDEEEDESSDYDKDDDIDIEGDEEEDEMSIRHQIPISLPSDTEIARLMAIPTPPPSPLSPLSSPLPYEEAPLGYRAAKLRWRESSAAAAARLREPVRDDLYRFVDIVERGEGSTPATMEFGYGIKDAWDDLAGAIQEIALTTIEEIRELRAAYHKLEAQLIQALTALKSCQTQLTAALGRIQILEAARVPAQPEGVAKALAAPDADRNTNGDDSHVSGIGVVKLTQWFEKMETVFRISNYSVENQIKFSTCTLLGSALTWWNSHIITVGPDVAYAMTCVDLKKKMSDKYCPRGEIKKLKELVLLCVRMFPEVSDKIERYVGGLPEVIHGSVVASRPKTMQEAIEMANELMDKRNNTWAECQAENKRKFDDTLRNNPTNSNNRTRGRIRQGLHCEIWSTTNVNTANNQRGNGMGQKPTCYECGSQGHFRKDCLKFKNNNHGTQGGKVTAPTKVYAIGRAGTNPNSNVITGTFLLNNFYASILFDIGFDRSFMSTAFSSQIAITPTTLDHYYDVELADGRIIRLNSILRGWTLNFLNHPFNIDLMPVELGSFDAIIGMDWLAKYHAVIVCVEKIVRIP
nr:hypothetical protein [Tanacetum cinerariifolium]